MKLSTEVWLNDLHAHHLGHKGQTETISLSPFQGPGQMPGTLLDQFEGISTSFKRVSYNMKKDLEYKIKLEEKRETAKDNKTYEELPQVQKNMILMMGLGPGNDHLPLTELTPSANMQTVLKAKTGVKVQNHLQFKMMEKKCMVELALGLCTNINNGNLMCSSFSSSAIK